MIRFDKNQKRFGSTRWYPPIDGLRDLRSHRIEIIKSARLARLLDGTSVKVLISPSARFSARNNVSKSPLSGMRNDFHFGIVFAFCL